MNNSITSTEIEAMIKHLLKNKSSGPDGFINELYKAFKEDLTTTLLKLSQNLKRKECF